MEGTIRRQHRGNAACKRWKLSAVAQGNLGTRCREINSGHCMRTCRLTTTELLFPDPDSSHKSQKYIDYGPSQKYTQNGIWEIQALLRSCLHLKNLNLHIRNANKMIFINGTNKSRRHGTFSKTKYWGNGWPGLSSQS